MLEGGACARAANENDYAPSTAAPCVVYSQVNKTSKCQGKGGRDKKQVRDKVGRGELK